MMSPYRQRGAVLVVCLILLLIITAIAASTLSSGTFQTSIATNAQKRETVFRVAESAVEQVLPLSADVANKARKAEASDTRYSVPNISTGQPGLGTPTATVKYPGDEDGKRNLFLPGVALGGDVAYVVRNYEIEGSAKTSDAKVGTKVVLGVAKVESELGGP
jgi:hypothetical protein